MPPPEESICELGWTCMSVRRQRVPTAVISRFRTAAQELQMRSIKLGGPELSLTGQSHLGRPGQDP